MKCYRFVSQSILLFVIIMSSCQKDIVLPIQTVTFETLPVPQPGFWNGSDATGSFIAEKMKFPNQYNSSWQTWSGFAYSQKSDVTQPGYENQYSVFFSKNGSNKYALYYPSFEDKIFASFPDNEVHQIQSIDLCNTTYAALSMKNGDVYCKKFGGTTGNDPDWFLVTLNGFDQNGVKIGSVTCYMADYRFAESGKDYILDKWTTVDLTSLGKINRLSFEFSSSDTGKYGINTPTYVCFDNIKYVE